MYGEVRYADYKESDQVIVAEFDEGQGMDACLRALNGGEQLFGFTVTASQDEGRRPPRDRGGGGYGGGGGGYGGGGGGGGGYRGGSGKGSRRGDRRQQRDGF